MYAEEICSTADLTGQVSYSIQQCRVLPNLIRVPTRSAHVDQTNYHPTIEFDEQRILGWWCDRPTSSRFIGCCSHVSCAIWFLSYERWQATKRNMPSGTFINLATDSTQFSDFYDSSEEESDEDVLYSLP